MPESAPETPATEEWRPVPDFPGYEVSTFGRVRSHRRGGRAPQVLAPEVRSGYLRVLLTRDSARMKRPVHQLVTEAFHGPRPPGMETRHLDGVKDNNRPENLAWGTRLENEADKLRHGDPTFLTHCRYGHPYSGDNLMSRSGGGRRCRTCHNAYNLAYYYRRAARTAVSA